MKRIVMLVVVALVMAAMIVVLALPASAQEEGRACGEFISGEGTQGAVGVVVREEAGPEFGPNISRVCSPR